MTKYANNSLRPIAGNVYIPDSMEARGKIKPIAPTSGTRNGIGNLVVSGLWAYDWSFATMTKAEMSFWASLIFYDADAGIYSYRFVTAGAMPAARLWVDDGSLMDFNVAVIDMPKWNFYRNGLFQDVTVHFSYMMASR